MPCGLDLGHRLAPAPPSLPQPSTIEPTSPPTPLNPRTEDTANCDTVGNNLVDTLMGEEKQERLTPEEQKKFEKYDYNVDLTPPEEEGASS